MSLLTLRFDNYRSARENEVRGLGRWQLALTQINQVTDRLDELTFQEQIPIVIALIENGQREDASRIFSQIRGWAVKPLSADPDIPNNPGNVTRARYALPQLGPYFDDVELAMECIGKLEASDPKADYRKHGCIDLDSQLNTRIARSLASAKGFDEATDWAETLTDTGKQLQACVILLDMATEHIELATHYRHTPIATRLEAINPSYMVFAGGC